MLLNIILFFSYNSIPNLKMSYFANNFIQVTKLHSNVVYTKHTKNTSTLICVEIF